MIRSGGKNPDGARDTAGVSSTIEESNMGEHTAVERWLPIPGTDGYYEASSHGQIRSVDRTILRSDGVFKRLRGQVLKPQLNETDGRLYVTLHTVHGSFKDRSISRLVLIQGSVD